jgi:hypothetical protein
LQRYISKNHPDLSTGHAFWLANAILTLWAGDVVTS